MSAAKKRPTGPTPVESTRHADTRVNIPTGELADFVADTEKDPGRALYRRDPSLDPQLVWKGKEEEDLAEYLAVASVPVYIQEKIDPRAIIENLRDTACEGGAEPELTLFDDFDGLRFDELVDFYAHEGNWSNRMILGDSLLVMNSLAEKENLRGKVQMIYVDPPYGIGFRSNWQVSTRSRDIKDGRETDVTRQPEQIKAFRDTWERGIHSYLSYLRDRLTVGRELLTESGSCFVQIGDENVHLVRAVMDEVFGRDNFVSVITFTKTPGGLEATTRISTRVDFLLWYAKDASQLKYRPLFEVRGTPQDAGFNRVELPDGRRMTVTEARRDFGDIPSGARFFDTVLLTKPGPGSKYEVEFEGKPFTSGDRWWGMPKVDLERLIERDRVVASGKNLRAVRYYDDFPYGQITSLWDDVGGAANPVYVVQTNPRVIQRCVLMSTDPGDLVLDPTCGSGTTSFVAEHWGRRWITIDTSRVALALARTRLMSARYPYYLLVDSPEGAAKLRELTSGPAPTGPFASDVRKGFVYKRASHITATSIAQNPDLHGGMSPEERERAIARHADTEVLVDQPFEDRQRVRVTGRFTFESLSPHRVLDKERPPPTSAEAAGDETSTYDQTILSNLRRAGVHNTFKGEELRFERLDTFAGAWLQAEGDFLDADGEPRRAAISLGPEHGTVGPDQIKEAAKEALRGAGFDMLVVCGFAFDPHAGETAREFAPGSDGFTIAAEERRLGKLRVLLARMNPDLAMGGDLLKKTGTGNLFMIFGEPDVDIVRNTKGIVIKINGVDVYDPTTGEVRSSSTDDIACWFIDTNYNGESFFVRHAYFTGDSDPYTQLRRALLTDIDEAAWASLYSTTSREFPAPDTGKVAVKVINHFGDEVMQVYDA